jgi:CheY-like chemotaxis protein
MISNHHGHRRRAETGRARQAVGEETKATSPPSILVAEDDLEMRTLLGTVLRRSGYEVQECRNGGELLVSLNHYINPSPRHHGYDLIISDIRMPGLTGLEIMEVAEFSPGFPPVILITAFGDEWIHEAAARMGAVAVFNKPFDIDDLLAKVNEIVAGPR